MNLQDLYLPLLHFRSSAKNKMNNTTETMIAISRKGFASAPIRTSHRNVYEIPKFGLVGILEKTSDGWWRVVYNHVLCNIWHEDLVYIPTTFVVTPLSCNTPSTIPPQRNVMIMEHGGRYDHVRARSTPSYDASVECKVPNETKATVIDLVEHWSFCCWGDEDTNRGWIHNNNLVLHRDDITSERQVYWS